MSGLFSLISFVCLFVCCRAFYYFRFSFIEILLFFCLATTTKKNLRNATSCCYALFWHYRRPPILDWQTRSGLPSWPLFSTTISTRHTHFIFVLRSKNGYTSSMEESRMCVYVCENIRNKRIDLKYDHQNFRF